MPGLAWVDGEVVPVSEARVPLLDSGFLRSDATYDVAAVWDGRFFRLDDHLRRLSESCRRLRLRPPLEPAEIREVWRRLVGQSGLRHAYVEAIVTRGPQPPGNRDPRTWEPRFYAFVIPYVWIVEPEAQLSGTDLVISEHARRTPTESFDPSVKNFQWGDLVRATFEAYDREGWVPLLLDHEGLVTEGPGFNVFCVSRDELLTPGRGVLEGITRQTIMEIAETQADLRPSYADLTARNVVEADEVFLTTTAGGVIPVATVDGQALGVGPVTSRLRAAYWEAHHDPSLSEPVERSSDQL